MLRIYFSLEKFDTTASFSLKRSFLVIDLCQNEILQKGAIDKSKYFLILRHQILDESYTNHSKKNRFEWITFGPVMFTSWWIYVWWYHIGVYVIGATFQSCSLRAGLRFGWDTIFLSVTSLIDALQVESIKELKLKYIEVPYFLEYNPTLEYNLTPWKF